jgi:hypothetical protein
VMAVLNPRGTIKFAKIVNTGPSIRRPKTISHVRLCQINNIDASPPDAMAQFSI